MAALQEQVKLDTETKNLLDSLKLVDEEPYNSVIKRLIEYYAETNTEINSDTAILIEKQIKRIHQGKVNSFKDVLKEFREKNQFGTKKSEVKKKREIDRGDQIGMGS